MASAFPKIARRLISKTIMKTNLAVFISLPPSKLNASAPAKLTQKKLLTKISRNQKISIFERTYLSTKEYPSSSPFRAFLIGLFFQSSG
jgi:hypothetical protein